MRGLAGAVRLQLQIVVADRGYLNEILTNPFFAVIFLGVVRAAHRDDLTSYALVAPVLITMWAMALDIAGDIVDADRGLGILEQVVASPTGCPTAVFGRVLTVSLLSGVGVVETGLVARLAFGVDIPLHHPLAALAAFLATSVAMTGAALILAGVCVLARTARTFQNSLSFPIYLLAGVLVPISFLPGWLHPVSRSIFLSWSAELMRDALQPEPIDGVALRLGIILALGAAGLAVGRVVLGVVLRRVRAVGNLGYV